MKQILIFSINQKVNQYIYNITTILNKPQLNTVIDKSFYFS